MGSSQVETRREKIRAPVRRVKKIRELEKELIKFLDLGNLDYVYPDGTINTGELKLAPEHIKKLCEKYNLKNTGYLRRKFTDTFSLARYIYFNKGNNRYKEDSGEDARDYSPESPRDIIWTRLDIRVKES